MIVFLNGQFVPEEQAVISVFDRSFLYGDGLFEAIPFYGGRPFRWSQHLERLARGAEFLKIQLPFPLKELRKLAGELVKLNQMPNAMLRLTLSRGPGDRGYSPQGAESPNLVMSLHPAPPIEPGHPAPWQLKTSSFRLPMANPLSSFKTNNKLPQVVARAEAEADGADDALMLNTNGEVVETTSANVFWVYQNTIYATPTGRGALPGITRAVVLELCQALGISTAKKVIQPQTLRRADSIFLSLSSCGVVPVNSLDGEPVNESPLVQQICQAYWEAVAKS
ncbi:MAG: aminotransferase class IV family protein [Chloroflexi bacterium]|nr:aminotransferase class IV family protein [Chloroflexota bacterium]